MTEKTKELTIPEELNVVPSEGGIFFDVGMFEHAQRLAKMLSTSTMIPDHFKDNVGNCLIGLNYAMRIKADPFMVLQNLYVVHGKPGVESKLAIAVFNASGRWTPLKFDYNGDKTECTAYATDNQSGEECRGVTVSITMANAEGWASKSGSKWKTMPELMLMYRSAMFFIRAYAPETLLGMQSKDELYDTLDLTRKPDGTYETMGENPKPSALKSSLTGDTPETAAEDTGEDAVDDKKDVFPCPEKMCRFEAKSAAGLKSHITTKHRKVVPPPDAVDPPPIEGTVVEDEPDERERMLLQLEAFNNDLPDESRLVFSKMMPDGDFDKVGDDTLRDMIQAIKALAKTD